MGGIIKTPLPLVYVAKGQIEVVDKIYPERKKDIWGIVSGKLYCHVLVDKSCGWNKAMAKGLQYKIGDNSLTLPFCEHVAALYAEKDKFNKTIEMLQQNDVLADVWTDELFCTAEVDSENVWVFNMANGQKSPVPRENEALSARLILIPKS